LLKQLGEFHQAVSFIGKRRVSSCKHRFQIGLCSGRF
jgi:hypothetical protein